TAGFNDLDSGGALALPNVGGGAGALKAHNGKVVLSALSGMMLNGTIDALTLDVSTVGVGVDASNGTVTVGRLQSSSGVTGGAAFGNVAISALGDFKVTGGLF